MDRQVENGILIAGTGPVGLIAALGLARSGFAVTLAGPEVRSDDRRTTALMTPALKYLNSLHVLATIESDAAPLSVMRIVDGTSRLIRSPVVTFRAAEIGERHFGLNIPNRILNAALEQAVRAEPLIDWKKSLVSRWNLAGSEAAAELADGTRLSAALAVAADGRASPARETAGIRTTMHDYPQAALVLNFGHSRGHGFTSTEFHTETGPFTQVPLPGDRSSLVWVVRPETADELAALDDATLSMRVEEKMQSMLGRVTVEPGRQIYPLSATLPARFAQNRVALIGEAAHVFPPIGAQGLNLGVRDVIDLVETAAANRADPGSGATLAAYDRKRRPDILARTGAVNLLNMSLLSNMLPAQMARSAGLGFLRGFAPVRAFFMREGMQPGSGLASALAGLREQIRR
ncbi:2-octaprenyl-6-methoxyphenyl hydroxylase [Mesorhizobium sp. L-8-10]|uniref:UbiH/UbiF family hydroxylase n=1 Tax=Mesorhizobium sp. L-8-10 TaxID=2744523 RepID=UPI0019262B4D|nr:UbiH/UbiF family hydroxylase [Mesorhizobium sp. L-8-10]BCH32841.1 2-octaprenyl-6-methoxyphenyl hydroxylase [Mesorhizobium sp. L-8-10]